MSELAKSSQVNFEELVRNSAVTLSLNVQSEMHLTKEFTEEEQQWYIANLYVYMNYHPTEDYPINLETVYKMIGFANKGNAMKTIKNNFTEGEDYKILLFRMEKQVHGGHNKEDVMLNVDTFKNLCMLAKTEKGKAIRKYYLKLETIYNQIIKKEIEEQKKLVDEQKKQIELLENKPDIEGFCEKPGYIYLIKDGSSVGSYKIGLGENPDRRLICLNVSSCQKSLKMIKMIKTNNMKVSEKMIHILLDPFRIKKRNEWFFLSNDIEVNYTIDVIQNVVEMTNKYTFKDYISFKNYAENLKNHLKEQKEQPVIVEPPKKVSNTNFLKKSGKLSQYNGVSWCIKTNNWMARLTKNNDTIFLGNYNTEVEAATVFNDYATYLNQTEGTYYQLNQIEGYIPNPRDIPVENLKNKYQNKSSHYRGVYFIKSRQVFEASLQYKKKKYSLLKDVDQVKCAKIYNEQALFFNNHLGTNYILNDIPDFFTEEKNHIADLELTKKKKYSRFSGVSYRGDNGKFRAYIKHNRKIINLGTFALEIDAARAYNRKADELNTLETTKFKYALNQFDDNEI